MHSTSRLLANPRINRHIPQTRVNTVEVALKREDGLEDTVHNLNLDGILALGSDLDNTVLSTEVAQLMIIVQPQTLRQETASAIAVARGPNHPKLIETLTSNAHYEALLKRAEEYEKVESVECDAEKAILRNMALIKHDSGDSATLKEVAAAASWAQTLSEEHCKTQVWANMAVYFFESLRKSCERFARRLLHDGMQVLASNAAAANEVLSTADAHDARRQLTTQ